MKPTPESRSPLDVPQTQSARAAREYSLLAETQKEVREILKEEIHGARQLVEYYDKYYGKIGFLNIAGRELEHKGLPPAGGVFLDHARQHFGAEDTISQLEQASEDELATM